MATVVSPNTIKLNSGQTVTPQNGGWYDGQQFVNGTLSNPGVINSQSTQQGAGQAVSAAVVAQTNPNNVTYLAKQGAPPPATTPATPAPAQTTASTGSTGATGTISAAPTIDLVGITNAAYNTPEITAANQAITDANTELTTRQQALADAQAEINDNPFYSEATRVGKSAALTSEANADMTVIQNKISEAQGTLASLKADAAIKVNAATGQYNIDNTAYQENLSQFNSLLSNGALDNASGTDIANLATQTGIPTSEIQSMITASQKKDNPVQIVQSQDANGQVMLVGVDSTGKVVSTTTIPGTSTKTSTATETKASDTQSNLDGLITSIKNYNNLKDIVAAYQGVMSIDDIYQYYNMYSPFGAAQNTLAEVKAGTITK